MDCLPAPHVAAADQDKDGRGGKTRLAQQIQEYFPQQAAHVAHFEAEHAEQRKNADCQQQDSGKLVAQDCWQLEVIVLLISLRHIIHPITYHSIIV